MMPEVTTGMMMATLVTSAWRQPWVRSSSAGFLEEEAPLRPPDLSIIIAIIVIISVIITILIIIPQNY